MVRLQLDDFSYLAAAGLLFEVGALSGQGGPCGHRDIRGLEGISGVLMQDSVC